MKLVLICVLMSLLTSLTIALITSYQIQSANAQTVSSGKCNCILDSTSYASVPSSNVTGMTIPSVDLLKNETVVSATEGNLSWISEKGTELTRRTFRQLLPWELFKGDRENGCT